MKKIATYGEAKVRINMISHKPCKQGESGVKHLKY